MEDRNPPSDQRLRLNYVVNDYTNPVESPHIFFDFEGGAELYHQEFSATPSPAFRLPGSRVGSGRTSTNAPLPNFGTDNTGESSRGLQSPVPATGRKDSIHVSNLRGSANGGELSQAASEHLGAETCYLQSPPIPTIPYPSPRLNSASRQHTPMQALPYSSASSFPQARGERPSSRYSTFRGAFETSESATDYRKYATRFGRRPYREPDGDGTIDTIANDRKANVKRIYDAMTRGDIAKDNSGSIAMKRWVHEAFYPSTLVESFAHKVFDCLLEQAKEGFRGWQHNDYATDDRKGEPEDRNFSCAERLDSIIRGLEEEKTVCEDVMSSACQIRMFVNAPRAYARRKEANRNGNSKRGRSNALAAPKPIPKKVTKTRKLTTQSTTRLQHAISSAYSQRDAPSSVQTNDLPLSPLSQPPDLPYFLPQPPIQQYASYTRPYPMQPAATSLPSDSFVAQNIRALSPAQLHETIPRFKSLPPPHEAQFMSPPTLSLSPNSVPVKPELQHTTDDEVYGNTMWPQLDTASGSLDPLYSFNHPESQLNFNDWTFNPSTDDSYKDFHDSSQPHDQGLPLPDSVDPNELYLDPSFRTVWNDQNDIQCSARESTEKVETPQ